MTVLVHNLEEKIVIFFKTYGKYILSGFGIGVLTYFMMM